jgi:hypothetical protein
VHSPDGQIIEVSEADYKLDRAKYFQLSDTTIVRVRDVNGKAVMTFGYFQVAQE